MPKTLLLADDSVVIQKLVGLSFANEDVDLVTTDNGDDAVTKARECRPDVVLADVVMPGMSGYEVCEAIKNDPQLAGTPVLLLTGTFEAFDEARAQQAGSDGHITKPFEAQALVDRVTELLTRGRTTAAPPAADAGADFFDSDASAAGRDVTRSSEPAPVASAPSASTEGFDFGFDDSPSSSSGGGLPPLDDSDLLGGAPEPGDRTVAFMPDNSGPVMPPQESPRLTGDPNDYDPLAGGMPEPTAAPAPAGTEPPSADPWSDRTDDPLSLTPPGGDPFAGVESSATAPDPALTTVIMSEGNSDSDAVHLGPDPTSSVRSLDDELGRGSASPLGSPEPAGVPPSPNRTILADDLFASDAGLNAPPRSAQAEVVEASDVFDFGSTDSLGDSSDDLIGGSQPAFPSSEPTDTPPAIAGEYDVSQSDLIDPFEQPAAPASPLAMDDLLGDPLESMTPHSMPAPEPVSAVDDLLGDSAPMIDPAAAVRAEPMPEPSYDATPDPMFDSPPELASEPSPLPVVMPPAQERESGAGPDISPVMRQRIHETLERVAWEAFADLSETMVKQVLERVESIAWEVIPQMAEALVKEEIRRMKGEDEE